MPVTIGGSGPITGVTSINTSVSDTELGYLDGVTSAIQSQINTAGGLVKITDQSFTSVSSVSVNSCFTSTYDNYRVLLQFTALSIGETDIYVRLRAGGTDNSGSNYGWFQFAQGINNTSYNQVSSSTTAFLIGRIGQYTATVALDMLRPAIAIQTMFQSQNVADGTTTVFIQNGGGRHTQSTAYDGMTIYTGGGTFSGTVRVYGYRN